MYCWTLANKQTLLSCQLFPLITEVRNRIGPISNLLIRIQMKATARKSEVDWERVITVSWLDKMFPILPAFPFPWVRRSAGTLQRWTWRCCHCLTPHGLASSAPRDVEWCWLYWNIFLFKLNCPRLVYDEPKRANKLMNTLCRKETDPYKGFKEVMSVSNRLIRVNIVGVLQKYGLFRFAVAWSKYLHYESVM